MIRVAENIGDLGPLRDSAVEQHHGRVGPKRARRALRSNIDQVHMSICASSCDMSDQRSAMTTTVSRTNHSAP
ncbi:MAG TPA: hypothetical protein VHZ98_13330, partial [Galbitalea sp.]|nr:hypothetical protein [Galbitalea sp.]